jgi:hypothetical protein
VLTSTEGRRGSAEGAILYDYFFHRRRLTARASDSQIESRGDSSEARLVIRFLREVIRDAKALFA